MFNNNANSLQLFSACQKLTTSKSSRPTTPNHYTPRGQQPSYNPAGPYVMASPDNARATGNGYPGSGMISGGATPSSGFQHSPHHASIPSSYHKVNNTNDLILSAYILAIIPHILQSWNGILFDYFVGKTMTQTISLLKSCFPYY